MKASIEISDELLEQAKRLAVKRRIPLRAIIEQGLRNVLDESCGESKYALLDMGVEGTGLQPEFSNKPWSHIRQAAYGRATNDRCPGRRC